ncbi:Sensor histidine kinase DesK [Streptomyces sp. MBT84]|nr:Sensor histidine kinase DesK [Streptomyces sp. MBT84]
MTAAAPRLYDRDMPVTAPLPLVKRVSPRTWIVLVWCASTLFTLLTTFRLPGETEPEEWGTAQLYRWDGLLFHVVSALMALYGAVLLRTRPLVALALLILASICEAVTIGVSELPMAQYLAPILALYFIAAAAPRRTSVLALVLGVGALVAYIATRLLSGWAVGMSAELAVVLVSVISWLLGDSAHQARVHAERLSAQASAQAVTAERLRIAREMHDTVAHSIGIIALQAGAAARVTATQPDAAREAMRAVETTGRETLAGLRRMLVALRAADAGHGDGTAAEARPAGLADVDRLAAATTAAGVQVDVRWLGEPRRLPPDIDLSAFRIIQESVTNVVRHSGTHACRVTVDYGEDDISLEVTDDGRGHGTSTDTGFGLAGMRERVALLQGGFSAEPRPEGGFRVAARLPLPVSVR